MRETTEFARRSAEFEALNTQILGVSSDSTATQEKHATQCGAGFPILSDKGGALAKQLGIASFIGTPKRTTYLLDRKREIVKVFSNVKVDGHAEEVLRAVQELQGGRS